MDVVGAAMLLLILMPILSAIAVFIKCVSKGPVLYRQRRYGVGGRPFRVWKFRTIEVGLDRGQHRSHVEGLMTSNGKLTKRDEELQVIIGGRWLRKYGVDELPQLINVLRGEMSLVGPRPDVIPFHHYSARHQHRFNVLPGITGLWQVKGKNRTTFTQMMQLDLMYVRRRSVGFDLMILLMTLPAVVRD
jgi:lipopolysaccharide/colanic/teichoic acid biosynthesis glycosyltransferase